MVGVVGGVAVEESFIFGEDGDGNTSLPQSSASLLRLLHYSNIPMAILCGDSVPSEKADFITKITTQYSCCTVINLSVTNDTFDKLLLAWGDAGGICFYLAAKEDEELFNKISNQGWRIIVKRAENHETEHMNVLYINKLEQLFVKLCSIIKKESRGTPIMTVGYVMKPSREEDFLKRGAFPMNPSQNGLMFIPIQMDLPLSYQMQYVDIILHKATDEIIAIDLCASSNFSGGISYSKGMQELKRYIQDHPECCVIDPLDNIHPLLDRFRIQQILLGLEGINMDNHLRIRAPHFLKVSSFSEPNLEGRLSEANLSFPNIVKPQVACGVADAHNMAVVFRAEDFKGLSVPVPAIIQEYVDHGSSIYKFYVLGENVFHATRKSMPNANVLLSSSEENGSAPILFDSLKSLPTSNEGQGSNAGKHSLDVELVTAAAHWLKKQLYLTIFGFDVVVQEGSGDHVIVDVNYLPSFKEIPVSEAIPAFWDAIRSSYDLRKAK